MLYEITVFAEPSSCSPRDDWPQPSTEPASQSAPVYLTTNISRGDSPQSGAAASPRSSDILSAICCPSWSAPFRKLCSSYVAETEMSVVA